MNSSLIHSANREASSPDADTLSPTAPASSGTSPQQTFVWGAGIECSFIPHLDIDQFEWTQHNQFWKEDFKRARNDLGLSALRYALPWHKIEKRPGHFEWAEWDARIEEAQRLGLDLYLDVMHFGTPTWLRQAVGDPEFPEALERFAHALVTRYRSSVKTWCPCNEPLVLALFSGDFGFWPPHSRKWMGYMPVLSRVVQATSRAIRAIRRADSDATVLLCDNVENYKTRVPELQQEAARRNLRRYLAMDLLLGKVDRHHPLFAWVTNYGLSELDLNWFASHPQSPDILGIDYYPNSEWQLDKSPTGIHQRRSETPLGLYGIARAYYQRYGLPMMLTETSADGHAINREIWLDQTVQDCRRLREEGVPMNGYFWWPMVDQVDWDGALTHHVGKIHNVGIYTLNRQTDGVLSRTPSPLAEAFTKLVRSGNEPVSDLAPVILPFHDDDQGPPLGTETISATSTLRTAAASAPASTTTPTSTTKTSHYGIVVFSHLRWGFVWQRPQQFLSRFARKHKILFVEEPIFDLSDDAEPRLDFHNVMPGVTVICPHMGPSWRHNPQLPLMLRDYTRQGIDAINDGGEFDLPLLWYYSPMDSSWSLGHFQNRGVVYDCMDELSQFTGAPKTLVEHEARLMSYADVVFTGGFQLGEKKAKQHPNVHPFGCGVDFGHFSKASDKSLLVPPDIDFMNRPILGWFGVIDERVDYALVGEMAKLRPNWSFAMVGPVVKVDPNALPHAPNLFWLGGRDYQQLPSYCRAFDINMMCFAINSATEFINPTKGLEYMATGKPIVGTPVRDVVRQWSDIVRLASTPHEFIAAAEDALRAGPNDPRVQKGIELAKKNSWEGTVDAMQSLIRDAIKPASRPSARAITPLTPEQLETTYTHTPGS